LLAAYLQRENIHFDLPQYLIQGLFCLSSPQGLSCGLHSNFNFV
jgi:hypothetical protein